jgi:hypothetical protein
MTEIQQLISDFNEESINFANQLTEVCPDSIISGNVGYLQQLIKKNPKYIIDQFTLYVLKYKKQIDSEDNDFFLKNEFAKDSSDKKNVIGKMFELKDIWTKLSNDNKKGIFTIMQILCYYSEQYYIKIV